MIFFLFSQKTGFGSQILFSRKTKENIFVLPAEIFTQCQMLIVLSLKFDSWFI